MFLSTIFTALALGAVAFAHCDSVDGPVVQAARRALASGDVNAVLPWVRASGEPQIREAFARTIKVRKLDPEAAALADTWFFETVVRVHRAGEGAAFDGIKPAGAPVPAGIEAADKALETGQAGALQKTFAAALENGLRQRLERVLAARDYKTGDVEAGRRYVAAYVDFIHYAERLHSALEPPPAEEHHH